MVCCLVGCEKEEPYNSAKDMTDQSIRIHEKWAEESRAESHRRVDFSRARNDVQLNHALYLQEKRYYAKAAFRLSQETNAGDMAIKEMQLAEKKRSMDEKQEKLNDAISRLNKYAPDADTLKKMTDEMSQKETSFQTALDAALVIMKHGEAADKETADQALDAIWDLKLFEWFDSKEES